MNAALVQKINLIDVLSDEFPDVPDPPEDEFRHWTEAEIRLYFANGGLKPAGSSTITLYSSWGHRLIHISFSDCKLI
jgi:hypothetical protein